MAQQCEACNQADFYRDCGYPEEIYLHCYSDACSCGCSDRKDQAIAFFKDSYFKRLSKRRLKAMKLKYPEEFSDN